MRKISAAAVQWNKLTVNAKSLQAMHKKESAHLTVLLSFMCSVILKSNGKDCGLR